MEQLTHVPQGGDRYTHAPHFSGGENVIGVETDLCGKVECDGKPGCSLFQKVPVPGVTLFGRTEARVLPHRPKAAPVHLRVDAPCKREAAWRLHVQDREIFLALRMDETP